MSTPTTYDLVKPYEKKLEGAAEALLAGNYRGVAAKMGTVVLAAATGHPELGVLAPFMDGLVGRIFESAADAQMREAMETFATEDDRAALAAQITEATAELLDEAIVTIAKIQHAATAQNAAATAAVRDELRVFRERFEREAAAAPDAVRAMLMNVRNGGTGIRVGATSTRSVFVSTMNVQGNGSVGIDLS